MSAGTSDIRPEEVPAMRYSVHITHADRNGVEKVFWAPVNIAASELSGFPSDVFRWLDQLALPSDSTGLRPNSVIVEDADRCVVFSAYRA